MPRQQVIPQQQAADPTVNQPSLADSHAPTLRAATVGTFDGVHRGHMEVIRILRSEAARRGLSPSIITFDRHPLEVIAPQRAPLTLLPTDEKRARLLEEDMEVIILPFDNAMMHMTARDWMRHMRRDLGVRLLVMGYDNTFGSDGRHLSAADYQALAQDEGLELIIAPAIEGCSSSLARKAVARGDMPEATRILGHLYTLTGTVVEGDRLGRTIGYPTANLDLHGASRRLLPPYGVYLTRATLQDGRQFAAVTNIGVRPSVTSSRELRIETHLLDFDEDIYGTRLSIGLLRQLRPERRFAGLHELREAIAADEREARRLYPESESQLKPNHISTNGNHQL
ncbi:MAG: riboflavin biosynthesis protein RibF [Muribaculaceae bacterium]|nr:riboflavin biosynthesis protein RibF [Muribaculaceae bacterium]